MAVFKTQLSLNGCTIYLEGQDEAHAKFAIMTLQALFNTTALIEQALDPDCDLFKLQRVAGSKPVSMVIPKPSMTTNPAISTEKFTLELNDEISRVLAPVSPENQATATGEVQADACSRETEKQTLASVNKPSLSVALLNSMKPDQIMKS